MSFNRLRCKTVFDITQTGVTGRFRPEHLPRQDLTGARIFDFNSWNHARNQQRNLETVVQILSLRAQISDITTPVYDGDIWQFDFSLETPGAYGENFQSVLEDIEGVPVIPIPPGVADTELHSQGRDTNIWIENLQF